MATDAELMECIEACRTCGIFFLTTSNFLRRIFTSATDDSDMVLIRKELETWDIKIEEKDGYPQFICSGCVHEFQKLFKFRSGCIELQVQWRHFYKLRQENHIQIKTEELDQEDTEKKICDFIYVDDLSDCEHNNDDNNTSMDIANVPIKEKAVGSFENNSVTSEKKSIVAIEDHSEAKSQVEITDKCQSQQTPTLRKTIGSPSKGISVNLGIQCRMCTYKSKSTEQHHQHMQRIHDVKDRECHICYKKFKNATAKRLKFHLQWHKLSKHIKCAQCGFFCDSRITLREHKRAAHSKIECKICGKRMISKKIHAHMWAHEIWSCSYCSESFDTEDKRESHLRQMHTKKDANNSEMHCIKCPCVCSTREQLEEHVKNCQVGEYFDQQLELKNAEGCTVSGLKQQQSNSDERITYRHQDAEHSTSSASSSVCETDDSDSENEDDTTECDNEHNKTSREMIEKFVCAQCTKTFEKPEQLFEHYNKHSKPKIPQLTCHICGKEFYLKFILNRHLKKHKKASF